MKDSELLALPRAKAARDERSARINAAVYEFLNRRNKGESVTSAEYIAAHPDLMPELGERLAGGTRKLRQAHEIEKCSDLSPGNATDPTATATDAAATPAATSASLPVEPHLRPRLEKSGSIGRHLIRHYQLIREVSTGGQGTVFEATQESTGRRVAVKIVPIVSRNSVARFEREVSALATLHDPGIVTIIDRGQTAGGAYFLVMDFIDGCDLDAWVAAQRTSPTGQRDILVMFAKIAAAIEAAHRKRIIHRDLKPSNIRVDENNQPHIVDFGFARLHNDSTDGPMRVLTMTGNIVGSIPWASPEQASGNIDAMDASSDIYSLGILLYQALTEQFPYVVHGPLHVVTRNICETLPTDPRKLYDASLGRIDALLAAVILKCLEKRPFDRFQSGRQLHDVLQNYLGGTLALPRSSPRWRRTAFVSAACLGLLASLAFFVARPTKPPFLSVDLPTMTNTVGMKFVRISPGRFIMGSSGNVPGNRDNEAAHSVQLTQQFYLSVTEVTRGQYVKVMGALPDAIKSEGGGDDLPVSFVSWNDANAFCDKLSKREGMTYKLPTEAQWEYACRAGTLGEFAGRTVEDMAWYSGNSGGKLHPVGLKAKNQWGLLDMEGNVAEWVEDTYVDDLGRNSEIDPIRIKTTGKRVMRGGSAMADSENCRTSFRDAFDSSAASREIGLRIVFVPARGK